MKDILKPTDLLRGVRSGLAMLSLAATFLPGAAVAQDKLTTYLPIVAGPVSHEERCDQDENGNWYCEIPAGAGATDATVDNPDRIRNQIHLPLVTR